MLSYNLSQAQQNIYQYDFEFLNNSSARTNRVLK